MICEWPPELSQADFARLRFTLDFLDPFHVELTTTLGLRQSLRAAARRVSENLDEEERDRINRLFDPAVSFDPVAVRRYQKPAPAFVILPFTGTIKNVEIGDRLALEVLFFGTGVTLIRDFLRVLIALGQLGLDHGETHFEVSEAASLDLAKMPRKIWQQNEATASISPEIISLDRYMQRYERMQGVVIMNFMTPVRLMVKQQPLRSPGFSKLFPFMLRRVTSMLYAHCGLELCEQPNDLIAAADVAREYSRDWRWLDWRSIGNAKSDEHIGGFLGTLKLDSASLGDICWIVVLSQLFGLGKGAAYGAGNFYLSFD